MKRFIDLRGQGTGSRFAWYDTVTDSFETHGTFQDWDTWAEFEDDYEGDEIERYKGLTPEWAFREEDTNGIEAQAQAKEMREEEKI
jgi:hypothetical protein